MLASRSCARRFVSGSIQRRCYTAPSDGAIPPAKQKYVPATGTYPKGFRAGSAHAGVKASNTRFDDLALITSDVPSMAAGVFTTNVFKAAPVQISKRILIDNKGENINSVVVNSGCANAVTGKGGLEDAITMVRKTEEALGVLSSDVPEPKSGAIDDKALPTAGLKSLVMSTGVIGQRLPIDRITSKIPALQESLGDTHDHWLRAARAICTTDTFPKLISRTFKLPSNPDDEFSIVGMTKGAGMIAPNMATLLSIICTDVSINRVALRTALQMATKQSFNAITIDGDTSTNDTVAIFANGAASTKVGNGRSPDVHVALQEIVGDRGKKQFVRTVRAPSNEQSEDYLAFERILTDFMTDLAKLVVRDGEGATKFVTVKVVGAYDEKAARRVADAICRSSLVKTALYGKDANWGRILCAVGYSDGYNRIVPEQTSVSFIPTDGSEALKLLVRGEPESVDEERAAKILEMEDLEILVDLNDGGDKRDSAEFTMWTCDFSHEYVTINGDYRT